MAISFPLMLSLSLLLTVSFAENSFGPLQSISDGKTLVSKEGVFEFGFFSPGNSKNRYVGIWYKNIPVRTVVWVANRCNPIHDSSGMLRINNAGNLVLLDESRSVVWSTKSSKQAKKPKVQLLDSGNLILKDVEDRNSESYLWQSFDYPCDTLLPGMPFGWDSRTGLNRQLSAWRNWDDPCPGDLSFGTQAENEIYQEAYLRKGMATYYRSGPWNGIGFSGAPDIRPNQLYDNHFVFNDSNLYSYSLKNNSVISIIIVNQTNSVCQRLVWMERNQNWRPFVSAPRDDCDTYGRCGANGNCVISETAVCQCVEGFKPKSQEKWDLRDCSEGCIRENPLNCQDGAIDIEDDFVKLVGIKMPDTSNTWYNDSMNLKECRVKCLNNCACMAYSNRDIRGEGKGCRIWFGDLWDIRQISGSAQELYVRIPALKVGIAKDAPNLGTRVVIPVLGSLSGMLLVGYYFRRKRLKGKRSRNNKVTLKNRAEVEDSGLPLFSLATIKTATNNFSENNKLGQGGFGLVYRGMLANGQEFAVKRLSLSSRQGINELTNEVSLVAKLQHRNLVRLLGCCIHKEEKLLIYEYMPNKSLDSFIFDPVRNKLVDWSKRFQIICGIARGLQYLHLDSRLRIIHRDLKASNILLDNEMNPKISDFGIAKTFGGNQTEGKTNRIVGTYGYMAPEYAFNGLFSTKSDIFSFGIIVLEIVSGKRSTGFHHENNPGLTLIGHAWNLLKDGRPLDIIDAHLRDSYNNLQEVFRCIHVGLLCVQKCPIDRPGMSSVTLMLGSESELPRPKPPGYFVETHSQERDHASTNRQSFSKNTMTITSFVGR